MNSWKLSFFTLLLAFAGVMRTRLCIGARLSVYLKHLVHFYVVVKMLFLPTENERSSQRSARASSRHFQRTGKKKTTHRNALQVTSCTRAVYICVCTEFMS